MPLSIQWGQCYKYNLFKEMKWTNIKIGQFSAHTVNETVQHHQKSIQQ